MSKLFNENNRFSQNLTSEGLFFLFANKSKVLAKDILITSQLRAAMITNKKIKSTNYNIDTYKKKIYVYGISQDEEERAEVINEAKQILDIEDVISSILLIEDLRVVKN